MAPYVGISAYQSEMPKGVIKEISQDNLTFYFWQETCWRSKIKQRLLQLFHIGKLFIYNFLPLQFVHF